MSDQLLRQYETWECTGDGYPDAWHHSTAYGGYPAGHSLSNPAIKDLIRRQADFRCQRCGHPYLVGGPLNSERGEWSPCDVQCQHHGPIRCSTLDPADRKITVMSGALVAAMHKVEAQWRILTVHHLDEDKRNCRWWNLVALCQRCHLRMQRAVIMDRVYSFEHSDWFKPYAAGFYAWKYEEEDLTREETMLRLDYLLAYEHRFTQEAIF